jgi:hypothetical protein
MKNFWKHLALAGVLATIFSPISPPALGATTSFISGKLTTIDDKPLQGNLIRFVETVVSPSGLRQFGDSTSAYTDKNGGFILQVPQGLYTVYVGKGKQTSRCLSTSFQYQVAQERQTLDIYSPKFRTYSIQFNNGDSKNVISNIRPYLRQVQYVAVDSPGLGELSFQCDSQFFYDEPIFVWQAFEISATQTAPEKARFSYLNGNGQRIDTQLPEGSLGSQSVMIELPAIPSVKLLRKQIRFDGRSVVGKARFLEAPELIEFDLTRKIRLMYRINGLDKPQRWRTFPGRFSPNNSGLVPFKLQLKGATGKSVDVLLVGDQFSLASNILRIKTK